MKKFFLPIIVLVFVFSACAAQDPGPKMTFGKVTVHTFSSSEGMNAVVAENNALVLFDALENKEDAFTYKKFVDSLGKSVDRIVLRHAHDHHFKGIETIFPNVPFYSVDADVMRNFQICRFDSLLTGNKLWTAWNMNSQHIETSAPG